MALFELDGVLSRKYAQTTSLVGQWVTEVCAACGRTWTLQTIGPWKLEVEGATKWPDLLSILGPATVVFSERARKGLSGCTGVVFEPVQLVHVRKIKHIPPLYYLPRISGKVEIDPTILSLHYDRLCMACGESRKRSEEGIQRYKIVEKSWDGSDFCMFAGTKFPYIVCSEKVLHIAHEQRWTNARFLAVGTDHRHPYANDGINYLAQKWPPDNWELPDPFMLQPLEAWAKQLESSDTAKAYEALKVLTYADEHTRKIKILIPVLDSANAIARRDAANLLYNLHKTTPLEPAILTRVLGLKSVPT